MTLIDQAEEITRQAYAQAKAAVQTAIYSDIPDEQYEPWSDAFKRAVCIDVWMRTLPGKTRNAIINGTQGVFA